MPITDVPVQDAIEVAESILTAIGTPPPAARRVAKSLVLANQVGHDSHGIIRLTEYSSFVARGMVKPAAEPYIASGSGGVRVIDGAHGWGQVASYFALGVLADLADELGTATISMRNCNHIGRIGEYAEALAARGLSSIICCNTDPSVAPFGGVDRLLGTNPIAVGIPVRGSHPIVLDFATAASAEGKLRVARATGKSVEPNTLIDREGNPSVNPEDFYAGGALIPFGGHKGYGLSVVVELLGGALSGNHPSPTERYVSGNGVVMVAFKAEAFVPQANFEADIVESVSALRASRRLAKERPVLAPGDIEASVRQMRDSVLPVADEIWETVLSLRARLERKAEGID